MSRGAARGAASAMLSLIVLQGLVSRGGSGRVSQLLADVNRLVQRATDPTVPAIPDRRSGAAGSSSSPAPATPGAVGNFTTADAYDRTSPAPSRASLLPQSRQPF